MTTKARTIHQGGGARDLLAESELVAIDYATGKVRWRRNGTGAVHLPGVLTTAGGLLLQVIPMAIF